MPATDHDDAAALDHARATVGSAGADALAPRPWQHPGQPHADAELVRFAAWVARDASGDHAAVVDAGLRLLASARAELDQVEAALLFAARAGGTTWAQVARSLGLGSAQAAQQRLDRLLSRGDGAGSPIGAHRP
ncbi:hypothetical protein [Actinotalea solisilvae]|uniref:hypothetical protein n=1 Tax=Actinotalea solisilvae TaxID=2072922 RepID=UPI0018F25CCD|nr:hypothetical protein [Actinotalea solisilvae]